MTQALAGIRDPVHGGWGVPAGRHGLHTDAVTESPLSSLPLVAEVLGDDVRHAQSVDLGDGLTALVVEQPGQALTISTHRRIYQALVPVTTSSFAADMTSYWAARSKEGYLERLAEFILVADAQGRMVGWTGYHILRHDEHTIVYLDSTGMVPEGQSRGVMRRLLQDRVRVGLKAKCPTDQPVFLTARSESPIFYRLMRGLLPDAELFPNTSAPVPDDVAACAFHLADWLGQRHILEPSTLALRGAYDTIDELYGELPTTGDAELDELFRGRLGPLDAYLLIGRFTDAPVSAR